MGFEELRDTYKYLHKRRDYSKRKNKFGFEDFQENISVNKSRSPSSRRSRSRKSDSSMQSKARKVRLYGGLSLTAFLGS